MTETWVNQTTYNFLVTMQFNRKETCRPKPLNKSMSAVAGQNDWGV